MKTLIRATLLFLALLFMPTPVGAANRFGVCVTACTWDASSTVMWSTTSGGATGASVPGTSDAVVFDAATCVGGVTCTVTINTTVAVQAITWGACTASTTGCIIDFSANNNNVTLTNAAAFSGTGTGTRNFKAGNGTWTLNNATGTSPWNMATTTNLTWAANSSTILLNGASTVTQSFSGGGLTYNKVKFITNSGKAGYIITGANTFAELTIDATSGSSVIVFPSSTTTSVTAFIMTGVTASNPVEFNSLSTTAVSTISSASTPAFASMAFHGMTFTGGGTFAASSSFDLGQNTGITITGPSGGTGGGIIGGN